MGIKTLKIAVVSDLHCHPKRTKKEDGNDETYLLTDKLRTPSNDHPVESLLLLAEKNGLNVDLTLCPGDFTDKANVQGFISGWGFSLEIHRGLKSKNIIATVGNHDVDVYNNHSNYSLDIAKGIKRGFPVSEDTDRNSFWAKGCVFIEEEEYRVLVINSSHYHHNKESAGAGKVGDDLIEYIKDYLSTKKDDKINIAMSHHHPVDHSMHKLGEEDKIVNSDALLDVLGDFKFDIFIHGHKHDPYLRYHPTTKSGVKIPIFASGSFASSSNLMFTSQRNFFHIITITKDVVTKGEVETWTFFPNDGWNKNLDQKAFPPFSGFGNDEPITKIFNDIVAEMNEKSQLTWDELCLVVVNLKHLLPSESLNLHTMLIDNGYMPDQHLWLKPSRIFNLKGL